MVADGNYEMVDHLMVEEAQIVEKNFPELVSLRENNKGKIQVSTHLFHFNKSISLEEIVKVLDRMGYRPANIVEFLAFGAKYPEIQEMYPVISVRPSSVWTEESKQLTFLWLLGHISVPFEEFKKGRCVKSSWWGGGTIKNCRFLAVQQ